MQVTGNNVRQEKRKLTDLSEFLDRLGWAVCPVKVLEYMREQRRCPTGFAKPSSSCWEQSPTIRRTKSEGAARENPYWGERPHAGVTQLVSGQPPTITPVAIRVMPVPSAFIVKISKFPNPLRRSLANTIFL